MRLIRDWNRPNKSALQHTYIGWQNRTNFY